MSDHTVVLDLDGTELDLTDNGWVVQAVDLGMPVFREVAEVIPGADGTDDHTEFVGARNVIVQLHLSDVDDRQDALDALAPYLNPAARPTLKVATETWRTARRLSVRATGDMNATWNTPLMLEFALGFRSVGSPFWLGDEHTTVAWPAIDRPGRTYPRTYPWSYPDTTGIGAAGLLNNGNRPAYWVARIFGPVTGPSLNWTNDVGDSAKVAFEDDFEIAAGDYIEIDSEHRTVLLNGEAGAPRYSFLDFSETTWFRIPVGASQIQLSSQSYTDPAQAEITFHDTFL